MIKDLGLFAWRIGLVLIVAMPALYITAALAPLVLHGGHPVVQLLLNVQMVVPAIFMSIALGCALCLLVRIEKHLRESGEKN